MTRRSKGFTLVELLVVIAMIALVSALAATSMRSTRGEKLTSFGRAMVAQVNMVRHTAITQQQPTRLFVQKSGTIYTLAAQVWNPSATPAAFQDLGATLSTPVDVQLCKPDVGANLGSASPTCPLPAAFSICFLPSGASYLQTTPTCVSNPTSWGATLYAATVTLDKKLKLPLFGLTGMAKLVDQW